MVRKTVLGGLLDVSQPIFGRLYATDNTHLFYAQRGKAVFHSLQREPQPSLIKEGQDPLSSFLRHHARHTALPDLPHALDVPGPAEANMVGERIFDDGRGEYGWQRRIWTASTQMVGERIFELFRAPIHVPSLFTSPWRGDARDGVCYRHTRRRFCMKGELRFPAAKNARCSLRLLMTSWVRWAGLNRGHMKGQGMVRLLVLFAMSLRGAQRSNCF